MANKKNNIDLVILAGGKGTRIKKYLKQPLKIPNANNARENSFNLFLNEKYTNKEIKDIISAIVKVEKYYSK